MYTFRCHLNGSQWWYLHGLGVKLFPTAIFRVHQYNMYRLQPGGGGGDISRSRDMHIGPSTLSFHHVTTPRDHNLGYPKPNIPYCSMSRLYNGVEGGRSTARASSGITWVNGDFDMGNMDEKFGPDFHITKRAADLSSHFPNAFGLTSLLLN